MERFSTSLLTAEQQSPTLRITWYYSSATSCPAGRDMFSSRRSATSISALAVYIASLIVGGLHHHGHGEHSCGETPLGVEACSDEATTGCDQDACSLCAALQQAKAPPPPPLAAMCAMPAGTAAIALTSQGIILFEATICARAPPTL
jgi:hypothetical protein